MPRGSKPGEYRGGRQRGTPNKATAGIREIARAFVDDPVYRAALKVRLEEGTAGTMEQVLWAYGYGRPVVDSGDGSTPPTSITIHF